MSSQPPSQSPTTTKSKGKASQNSQPSQGFKAHWDTKSIEIFVKLCVEQRYPDAAKFREKPLTLADDMDILFSDVSATGEWAYTPSSGVFLDTEGSHTPLGDDTDTEIHPSELSNQCRRQKEGPSKKQKGNKKSAAGELSKTLNRIVDAVEASSSIGTQNAAMQNPHTITECLAKISTISGVSEDDELLVWAARLFMKPSLRESFMALPNDVLRLKFINLEIALEKARIPGFRD
ncbi:L10-interacting MYB domain-containing protein [Camellia lanceoleosa]|uniref:L10-interacting MYB domain-containing protein n=1 Tax=Camellia lanceoleosa TaxID=1840588 RepID=A0ACC0J3D0_9ERIC|nr:L10-interacting MYB domain-containing protein [Camellia lanceoleosa]